LTSSSFAEPGQVFFAEEIALEELQSRLAGTPLPDHPVTISTSFHPSYLFLGNLGPFLSPLSSFVQRVPGPKVTVDELKASVLTEGLLDVIFVVTKTGRFLGYGFVYFRACGALPQPSLSFAVFANVDFRFTARKNCNNTVIRAELLSDLKQVRFSISQRSMSLIDSKEVDAVYSKTLMFVHRAPKPSRAALTEYAVLKDRWLN
jgi:hypothetical protein